MQFPVVTFEEMLRDHLIKDCGVNNSNALTKHVKADHPGSIPIITSRDVVRTLTSLCDRL